MRLLQPVRSAAQPPPRTGIEARQILGAFAEFDARWGVPKERSVPSIPGTSPEAIQATEVKALFEVLHLVRNDLGMSAEQALAWIESRPLKSFQGQTPAQLFESGNGAAVLYYVRSISAGFQG